MRYRSNCRLSGVHWEATEGRVRVTLDHISRSPPTVAFWTGVRIESTPMRIAFFVALTRSNSHKRGSTFGVKVRPAAAPLAGTLGSEDADGTSRRGDLQLDRG